MTKMHYLLLIILLYTFVGAFKTDENSTVEIEFKPQELKLEVGYSKYFSIDIDSIYTQPISIILKENVENLINLPIKNLTLYNKSTQVIIGAIKAGHLTITGLADNSTYFIVNTKNAFVNIDICQSLKLDIVSAVVGWIYFVVWTLSFYPQLWENYKRKSVIGLNFDFLYLNFVGHTCYGIFNIGLYWIPLVKEQYIEKFSHVNPIQINDIAFSIHAIIATFATIFQTFIYEKGDQKISKLCIAILVFISLFLLITLILSIVNIMIWLEYLYMVSYVKLAITLIKYCPQAYFNFRRKSTVGWSIGNVLLDFTGGLFSILQMFIIAYNYADLSSAIGDPTKFGLGLFSIVFDILFMIQHYLLYRKTDETRNLISSEYLSSDYSSSNESITPNI